MYSSLPRSHCWWVGVVTFELSESDPWAGMPLLHVSPSLEEPGPASLTWKSPPHLESPEQPSLTAG